jgi:chromosome partitioning protein
MIIALVNQKGGPGKTALAYNLAGILSELEPVAVLDTDPQGSLMAAWSLRARDLPVTVKADPAFPLDHPLLSAPLCLVDTPPGHEKHARKALALANLVLVPLTPSPLDLMASLPLRAMAAEARRVNPGLKMLAVLNQVKANATLRETIASMAREQGLAVAQSWVPHTVAVSEAFLEGLPLNYARPRHPAVEFFRELAREAMEVMAYGPDQSG